MKLHCRILVTEKCNLSCPYCCNQLPEVREQFKSITSLTDVRGLTDYRSVNISGGEPLLSPRTWDIVNSVAYEQRLYLYTNGYEISKFPAGVFARFDGINLGIHHPEDVLWLLAKCYLKKINLSKVRLLVADGEKAEELQRRLKGTIYEGRVAMKFYKLNECINQFEDIFLWGDV